jgi:tetratricopeptide (TPR) repeat protein
MPTAATGAAERACEAGECENAVNFLERAVALEPHDFRLHYRLGLCYSGNCRPHALVHREMAIPYLRHALRLVGEDRGHYRAAVLDQLATTLCRRTTPPKVADLRESIGYHRQAAEIYHSLAMADEWARTHFNLGNSCCDLSEFTGEEHWQEAVFHFEESLRVRTLQQDRERHAAVLENLGSAYRRLTGRGDGKSAAKSIDCYHRALRIWNQRSHPRKYAALHNNIGNAFLSLPDTDEETQTRNLRRALRHFDRALRVQLLDKPSQAYGITQYNRAQAYRLLDQMAPAGNPNAAVACLEEAFAAFQACGEDRYTQLIRAQLDSIRSR